MGSQWGLQHPEYHTIPPLTLRGLATPASVCHVSVKTSHHYISAFRTPVSAQCPVSGPLLLSERQGSHQHGWRITLGNPSGRHNSVEAPSSSNAVSEVEHQMKWLRVLKKVVFILFTLSLPLSYNL